MYLSSRSLAWRGFTSALCDQCECAAFIPRPFQNLEHSRGRSILASLPKKKGRPNRRAHIPFGSLNVGSGQDQDLIKSGARGRRKKCADVRCR